MFKKLASIMIVVILVFSFALAEPTNRTSVFEFYELQSQRIADVKAKYGMNLEAVVSTPIVTDKEDCYTVNGSFGLIYVDKSDLTIESLMTTILDIEAEQSKAYITLLRALITISSLEMGEYEADGLEALHKIDSSLPADVLAKYISEFDNKIHPMMDSEKLKAGEEFLVYQDNYDYYASYKDYSGNGGKVYLTARAHE